VGTHINDIIMPTVQQPRRGATRRVLKAAGLALGAVLVSSQAQGAYAADGAVTAESTCSTMGYIGEVNSETNGDGLCACKLGYSDNQGAGASSPVTSPPLDCKYCAPGYYLKIAKGTTLDNTGFGAVCAEIDQTKLHSTTVNAAPKGAEVADVKNTNVAQAPTSANDGNFCAAGHYGTATGFDGTGCTACPVGGSSVAGSSLVTGCVPDCSSLTVAKDSDGTTPLSAGDGIQLVTSPSTGKLDDCETAPGYYLHVQADDADTAGALEIHKAPANFYARGQQNVVHGIAYPEPASANMVADTSPYVLVSACPTNSNSFAGSSLLDDCACEANFYPSLNACVACASGTTRAGTVSVTGTATCSAAASPTAASPTAASPTAESAGASTPIAVALAAAAAVPLLL